MDAYINRARGREAIGDDKRLMEDYAKVIEIYNETGKYNENFIESEYILAFKNRAINRLWLEDYQGVCRKISGPVQP